MIKLDVDPYCHECEKFEASVIGPKKNGFTWCKPGWNP